MYLRVQAHEISSKAPTPVAFVDQVLRSKTCELLYACCDAILGRAVRCWQLHECLGGWH